MNVGFCTECVLRSNVNLLIKSIRFEDGFGHSIRTQNEMRFRDHSKTVVVVSVSCLIISIGIGNKSIKCLVFDFSIRSDSQLFLFLSY